MSGIPEATYKTLLVLYKYSSLLSVLFWEQNRKTPEAVQLGQRLTEPKELVHGHWWLQTTKDGPEI